MASTVLGYLSIDGVKVKSVSTCTFSVNKIWSTDTGRSATGKMIGHIITTKKKLEVTWNYLTQSELKKIADLVDSTTSYHTIGFYNIKTNDTATFTGYFGDGSYPIYGFDAYGNPCVTGMSLSIIER